MVRRQRDDKNPVASASKDADDHDVPLPVAKRSKASLDDDGNEATPNEEQTHSGPLSRKQQRALRKQQQKQRATTSRPMTAAEKKAAQKVVRKERRKQQEREFWKAARKQERQEKKWKKQQKQTETQSRKQHNKKRTLAEEEDDMTRRLVREMTHGTTDRSSGMTTVGLGVQYKDVVIPTSSSNQGPGPATVQRGDVVTVKYKLTSYKSGALIDSGNKFTFRVGKGEVVQGWDIGLIGMTTGTRRHLIVPPKAGYGSKDIGAGPGAVLHFDITLLSIRRTAPTMKPPSNEREEHYSSSIKNVHSRRKKKSRTGTGHGGVSAATMSMHCLFFLTLLINILGCHGFCPTGNRRVARRSILLYDRQKYEYYDEPEVEEPNNFDAVNEYENDPYWDDTSLDFDDEEEYNMQTDYDVTQDKLDWESCSTDAGTAHVLLPDASVDRPTAIIHFVGGTFFGSSPNVWYRRLLEEVVQNTQAAVIATSVPVTLWQSPLQHVRLSRQIQRQFQTAWREVLLDEYGGELSNVPVTGLGHSLGSRLLTVLATLEKGQPEDREKRSSWKPPLYSSYILISFTNYGAGAGIPGIYQLNRASRSLERQAEYERQRRKSRRRNDEYGDDFDDYDDDEDWQEIFQDIQEAVQDQTDRLRRALTPGSKDLEFHPSPEQLWKAISFDSRYAVPQTLIVQFDDDEIDQSAKLANLIKDKSKIYFARLRGNHLTPVSIGETKGKKAWYNMDSQAGKAVAKLVLGKRRQKYNDEALNGVRQTITSYMTEVASKGADEATESL